MAFCLCGNCGTILNKLGNNFLNELGKNLVRSPINLFNKSGMLLSVTSINLSNAPIAFYHKVGFL